MDDLIRMRSKIRMVSKLLAAPETAREAAKLPREASIIELYRMGHTQGFRLLVVLYAIFLYDYSYYTPFRSD